MYDLIDNRQIRIFISSTFRDMQDERDYLMKRTFPKLRKLAAERDVTLTELDLRWGITEEESKSGKVVEICLREIENSIPFFIGIIGNRYGWVPTKEDLGGNVSERFSQVKGYIDRNLSVTEMEMQFGVLSRDEDMHAYFYIKDQEDDQDNPEMLNRLKNEVRRSKYPSSSYTSPEHLAQQVEESFTALLDKLFPDSHLSQLEKERIGQRSFMNQLCQNYIRKEKDFAALDNWLRDEDSHQIVVTGASGLGKSALIANWIKEKQTEKDRGYNIIYHFTGNGGSESSREHITKSLANEIMDIYGFKAEGLDESHKLEDLFLRVSSEGDKPLLIVIDAINQMVDVDNAKLLNWLPVPGKNIRILFSTLEDDRTMEVFKRRNYPVYTLEPLDIGHRSQLVQSYLKLYAKKLTEKQLNRIVADTQCENTLVLKTLLDELINFGIYERLDERIEYYLGCDTIDDFYISLLYEYEKNFSDYGDDFVETILSLIAASKNGLTEEQILSISNAKPLHWSQLFCALINSFCNKNGRINFNHTAIIDAVVKRYGLNEPNHPIRFKILSFCSERMKHGEANDNIFSEVPYQLYLLGDLYIDLLYNYISSPSVSATLFEIDQTLCQRYWTYLRNHNYSFECFNRYKDLLFTGNNPTKEERMLFSLRSLLHTFGEYSISLNLSRFFVECLESQSNISNTTLIRVYNALGNELFDLYEKTDDDFDASFDYFMKAIDLAKRDSLDVELAVSYNGLARHCSLARECYLAIKLAKMALKINEAKYGQYHHEVAANYNTLGEAYSRNNEYDKSIENYQKSVDILSIIYGDLSYRLIVVYFNLATNLHIAHRYEEALAAVNQSLHIIYVLYGDDYFDLNSYLELKENITSSLSNLSN